MSPSGRSRARPNTNGYVRGNANYRGKAYTFFNTDNPFYTKVGDYIIADMAVGVRTGKWDLGLLVRNLTDEKPKLSIDPGPDGFRVTTIRPRSFGISARATF
jgi:outer membrane receptor protein involved in Fe transport